MLSTSLRLTHQVLRTPCKEGSIVTIIKENTELERLKILAEFTQLVKEQSRGVIPDLTQQSKVSSV
jgi:hypothetical protein